MSGKIFTESENIHDDVAKILFDYYSKAAQKIVTEEMRLEGLIKGREEDIVRLKAEIAQLKVYEYIGFGAAILAVIAAPLVHPFFGALALVAIGVVVSFFLKRRGLTAKVRAAQSEIKGFGEAHAAIRRDYKVHKLGLAYVPVASQIPFEGQSILIDHTGTVAQRDFNLYVVKRQAEFQETVRDLEETLSEVPLVESSKTVEKIATDEHSRSIQSVQAFDYFGKLDRQMRSASSLLGELDKKSVSLPVIMPDSPVAKFLRAHGTPVPEQAARVDVFPIEAFDEQLKQFQSLNELKKSMESQTKAFEDFLQELMVKLAWTVQTVSRIKLGSTEKIMFGSNRILYLTLKASFNHYSPKLEADEIERIRNEGFNYEDSVESYSPFGLKKSSRVLYDPASNNWVAEDGSRTSYPFGVLQIHEEIVAPIVQNLMQETRLERMRIYNNIKDQKLAYISQWQRDTDDFYGRNRAEGNELINRMQSSLTDFTAAFNQFEAFEKTQKSMESSGKIDSTVVKNDGPDATSVAAYAMQSQQFIQIQQEFSDYMDRLQEDMAKKAEEFKHIEYYDASLRDGEFKRRSSSLTRVGALDERRKPLLAVDAYFAENADLPPAPDLDESARDILGIDLPKVVADRIQQLAGVPGDVVSAAAAPSRGVPPPPVLPPPHAVEHYKKWAPGRGVPPPPVLPPPPPPSGGN